MHNALIARHQPCYWALLTDVLGAVYEPQRLPATKKSNKQGSQWGTGQSLSVLCGNYRPATGGRRVRSRNVQLWYARTSRSSGCIQC
jgi:hypothetical protein